MRKNSREIDFRTMMRHLRRSAASGIRAIKYSHQQQRRCPTPSTCSFFVACRHHRASSSSNVAAEDASQSEEAGPPSSSSARRRKRPSFRHSTSAAIRGSEATDDANSSNGSRGGDDDATTVSGLPPLDSHLDSPSSSSSPSHYSSGNAAFAPRDPITGEPLDARAYLALASLSPWVPCPDIVVKRVLEIANANATDVHVDLGCGDGRFNFAAVDYYTDDAAGGERSNGGGGRGCGVRESWGIDIDANILERCNVRLGRRFVPNSSGDYTTTTTEKTREKSRLEFVRADLVQVVEREKWKYQRKQLQQQQTRTNNRDDKEDAGSSEDKDVSSTKYDEISARIANTTTIVTVYFVDDSLRILRPYLAYLLGGKSNVRVLTVGYEMKGGWEPSWVENVLGLTIFKYDMEFVSNVPLEWSIKKNENDDDLSEEEQESPAAVVVNDKKVANYTTTRTIRKLVDHAATTTTTNIDLDLDNDHESPEMIEYLKQKRLRDIEVLNEGLRIHHDERLDEFAGARRNGGGFTSSSSNNGGLDQQVEKDEEEEWDFDETEDPDVVLKEAYREMAEMKNMMTTGGAVKKNEGEKEKATPVVWKKP